MKNFYIVLLSCLLSSSLIAQNFEEITGTPFEEVRSSSIAFADIDNDGDQDVLITGYGDYRGSGYPISKLYGNDGNGNFIEILDTPFEAVAFSSIGFIDIDNDGDQDVLITGQNNNGQAISKLYTNDGNGNFTEVLNTPFDGVRSSSIAFADIDNDGDQDVLITGWTDFWFVGISKLYTNDGFGNFTEVLDTPFDGVGESSIAFADIDSDGDQDVLITGHNGDEGSSILYTNDNNGNFTEVTESPFEDVYEGFIAFADIDNDGDQDVLITGVKGNYPNEERIAKLYANDGNGNFTEVTDTIFEGVGEGSIAFADIDNDGDQDVLITGYKNGGERISRLYTNYGNGNFTEVLDTPFVRVDESSIAFADIDNDGDQDVLITGNIGGPTGISKLYRNLSPVGINEIDLFNEVSISPNPSNGLVNIDLGILTDVAIKVLNLSGQLIYYKESINTPIYQFELQAAPGIYILELSAEGEKQQFKLVKN